MELVDFLRARLDEDEERLDAIDHVQAPAGHMARERRGVEAKRRIVDLCDTETPETGGLPLAIRTLRLLALSYADHPDYDEAWRP